MSVLRPMLRAGVRLATGVLVAATVIVAAPAAGGAQDSATANANAGATIVVDTTSDQGDASGTDGVCRTASNTCSLRAAIQTANANSGPDQINFNIPGGGVRRIVLTGPLPAIDDSRGGVTIDGYTQPGATANTDPLVSNARILVELDGRAITTLGQAAILIQSAQNTIRGLSIFGAASSIELRFEEADGNRIVGNFLGTDATSRYSNRLASRGIIMNLGPDQNMIGTPALADRNVISGSGGYGIRINHGETSQNLIQNNIIGLSADGSRNLNQVIGIDLQFWTWGNLVGGSGVNEGNLIGGNQVSDGLGLDISHSATGNIIVGNRIGTAPDGRSAPTYAKNRSGVGIKDNASLNYLGDNVFSSQLANGIWNKHNYTGGNYFVNNRLGVGRNGEDLGPPGTARLLYRLDTGGTGAGVFLRGQDDIYHGNILANFIRPFFVSNTSIRNGHENYPDLRTTGNMIRMGTYYDNSRGQPIFFNDGRDSHPSRNAPDITGLGPGEIYGGNTCAGCGVEVYVSGSRNADGTLDPGTGTVGLTYIGWVTADGAGRYSMASPLIQAGASVGVLSFNGTETSELVAGPTVPTTGFGITGNPSQPNQDPAPPATPLLPGPYQPSSFSCSVSGATLSWDDVGAGEYYVFAVNGGAETYLGGHAGTSLTVPAADSYRVEHWVSGAVTNALCEDAGAGIGFGCSVSGSTLSWDDAGVAEYYVFAVFGDAEFYLGGHATTSMRVLPADSYRVEHWGTGQAINATCGGPGWAPFTCSVSGAALSWDDVGAPEYYVFAVNGGVESYLGGHAATSLRVLPADSYRVEHWIIGQATNALCTS